MSRTVIKILVMTTIILLPVKSFSAGAVRVLHVLSIYSDEKGSGLKHPAGVACNDSGLVIADSENSRLLRYTFNDDVLKEESQIKVPQMPYPALTHISPKGDIYVLDGRQRRIARLSPEGTFTGYIDPTGIPAPASYVPGSFAIDSSNNIYMLDILTGRVLVLNAEGAYQRQISFPEGNGSFADIAIDFKDNILLIDSINARVFSAAKAAAAFSPLTESLKEHMRFPSHVTTDNRGRIYITDRNGSRITVVGQDGSFLGHLSERGWKEGLLNYPSQMCINSMGDVFIADTNNSRIQIFNLVK